MLEKIGKLRENVFLSPHCALNVFRHVRKAQWGGCPSNNVDYENISVEYAAISKSGKNDNF